MRLVVAGLLLCFSLAANAADVASCYGPESGIHTASGERFNWHAMTAASRTLKFGTLVRVTYGTRSVVVKINDRGPFVKGRTIDLSLGTCQRLGLVERGVGQVSLEVLSTAPYQPKHGDWGVF